MKHNTGYWAIWPESGLPACVCRVLLSLASGVGPVNANSQKCAKMHSISRLIDVQ